MKNKCISILFLMIFIIVGLHSCQEDEFYETVDSEETITYGTALSNLMLRTSQNNGTIDDLLDEASCLSVNLPVTITVNSISLTINTLDDLALIQEIYNQNPNDDDNLELLYPITVTLNDYNIVVINSDQELQTFINECTGQPEAIECVNFQYPISFAIYNSDFQVIDTVTITNDQELHGFITSLETNPNGATLASLNFPVTMNYQDGTTIEVTNNAELEGAINAAEEHCSVGPCTPNALNNKFAECYWRIANWNGNTQLIYEFYFDEDGSFTYSSYSGSNNVNSGNWEIVEDQFGVHLIISNMTTNIGGLIGEWTLDSCNGDVIEFHRGEDVLAFEQFCSPNPFDCFTNSTITGCENGNGTATFDFTSLIEDIGCPEFYMATFHSSQEDAENDVNPIANTTSYISSTPSQIVYLRVEAEDGDYRVREITLLPKICQTCSYSDLLTNILTCNWDMNVLIQFASYYNEYRLKFFSGSQGVVYKDGLQVSTFHWNFYNPTGNELVFSFNFQGDLNGLSGDWEVTGCSEDQIVLNLNGLNEMILNKDCSDETDPLLCYELSNYNVLDTCLDIPLENNPATFNLTEAYSDCMQSSQNISYHVTEADALANTNAISDPINFQIAYPYDQNRMVYIRVETNNGVGIYPIVLFILNCFDSCDEGVLKSELEECSWTAPNNVLGDVQITFNNNFTFTIVRGSDTQTGSWDIFHEEISNTIGNQDTDDAIFGFFTMSGLSGDLASYNGTYYTVGCGSGNNELQVVDVDDFASPFSQLIKNCD